MSPACASFDQYPDFEKRGDAFKAAVRALTGEMRTGALEGVLTDGLARAVGLPLADVRRAVMLSGSLPGTVRLALAAPEELAGVGLAVLTPVQPMLASTAADVGYGAEDTDLGQRFRALGLGLGWVGDAPAYHQHHPVSDPPVEHVADIFDLLAPALVDHPLYRDVRDLLDTATDRVAGQSARGERAQARGLALVNNDRLLVF